MVCFMGALNLDEDHGTLCSSNVVGQGMTDWASISGEYPLWRIPQPGTGDGIVQGAAKDGDLVAIADIYWSHFTSTIAAYDFAAFGYDWVEKSGDEVQVVSNSYGESDEDADGWDYRSRYITDTNVNWNDEVSYLFSTGNGAPGYGTNAPPSAATAIAVGASTQMGACGGWDSAYDEDQITVGDVIPWSNRGPNASGGLAPDIVADGAYSSGAVPLNMYVYNGASSWEIWGGTSRSCPVAAGNLALVYQAYADTHGGAWPTYAQAKQFLQNGARDLNYDVLVQGAGSIDAGRSAALAAESGGLSVTPSMWLPGDFAGEAYDSFVRTVHAGDSVSQRFIVRNTGEYPVNAVTSDAWYQRSGEMTRTLTLDSTRESKYDFNRPDCLVDLTNDIPPGTDLMVIRTTEDIADFAPTGEFTNAGMGGATTHNVTRLLVYDWKDQDADGALWDDTNANDHVNIGEIDNGEYMRFTYHNNFGNTHEVRVQTPLERMHDGVYLGLQHRYRTPADPTTAVNVEISFWDRVDMPWLTGFMGAALGPDGWADFYSTLHVPPDAPPGVYQGEIRVTDGTNVTVVPVVINVAADDYAFEFGQKAGEVADLMPNGTVFGGQDWNWRAESGDWRFFWTDGTAADELPDGAAWLVHTTWPDRGAAQGYDTDIDTLLYGPYLDEFSETYPEVFGPYGLSKTGGSANTNLSAGIWTFQTNSGTTEEWVAGPLAAGANQVMVHNVLYDGLGIGTPFEGETGVISVDPSKIMVVSKEGTGTTQVAFNTYDLGLTGAAASAYGLTRRIEATHEISQGEWWWDTIELTKAAYLDVRTACEGQDIDLYVWYSGDGGGTWSLVAASETSTGDEHVRIEMPPDGLYEIDVYGYSVSGTQPFDLVISSPMGDDMTLSGLPGGPVPAGSGFTLGIDWTKVRTTFEEREGTFEGVVFLGPTEAPSAVQVPVALRYPFYVESSDPAAGALVRDTGQSITVTLSKRLADSVKLDDDSVWLMKGGTDPVECDLSYDATAAVITVDPVDLLEWGSEYDLHLSLRSRDGDQMNRTIVFSTNAAPVAADDAYTVSANVTTTVDAPGVLENDTDAEDDALCATVVSGPTHGTLSLSADGGFSYRPVTGFVGTDTFTYKASDGAADSNVATVTITVSPIAVTRVEGRSRVLTAVEASKRAFPAGAPAVVIATGYNWPDALGGAALAGAVEGPVLLTLPKTLPAEVAAEIARLGAHKAYILGGASAVGADVEGALRKQLGSANVKRIAGRDRYETARKIAAECVSLLGGAYDGTAFVATGLNFPDALGASPLAAAKGWPIYLVDPAKGADATLVGAMRAARVTRVVVLGGTKVVPAKVESDLKSALPATTVRRAGDNRYQTAIKVASFGVAEGLSWDRLAIATGENFPDALAGGVLQGKGGSVMLLTPASRLDGDVAATLAANKASVSEVRFLGGTNALGAAVRTAVLNALK
jgi:putative cell wall-binding protein